MTVKAVPLVQQRDGAYECVAAGLDLLRSFKEPLGVIVVAGRYRSGKSFLLNRGVLRVPPKQGFPTGSTVNACTKGIWIYPQLLRRGPVSAVVLDTEGTNSMEATPEQDAKLLSVAVGMASTFVFNSSGALDEASFAEIGIVTHATRSLQNAAKEHWVPPRLLWTLRDFTLQLEDPDGKPLTPDEYLEACLAEKDKGEARNLLREFFTDRTLIPLVRPVADEGKLQRLNTLPDKDLRVEFLLQLQAFSATLDEKLEPKRIGGCAATGEVVAHLCEQAVGALNRGAVPCIADSFTFLLESQALAEVETARSEIASAAANLSALMPCPPECLRLPRPAVPAALASFVSVAAKFSERADVLCQEAEVTLSKRNDAERKRWLQDYLERLARRAELDDFIRFLEVAHQKLGVQQAYEASTLVFEVCVESSRTQTAKLDRALAEARKTEAALERAQEAESTAADALRSELEEALVHEAAAAASLENTGLIEIYEEHCNVLAAELSESSASHHAATRDLSRAAAEIEMLREEASETTCSRAAAHEALCGSLRETEARASESCAELKAALVKQEDAERSRLEEAKAEMLLHVQQAQKRGRSSAEAAQARAAEAHEEAASASHRASQEARHREEADSLRECAEASGAQARTECSERIAALRRQHTEVLAEKTRMMRDAHEHALVELRRTREKATESDRAKVRLEIENESHKRSLDSHRDDLQQLAKVRRYAEDLRDRLNDRESTARTSAALLDDHRRRLAALEEHVRDLEASHAATAREKDYRIAVLEVQLSAAQG